MLNFDSLTHNDDGYGYISALYIESGYELFTDYTFASLGTLNSGYTGSTALLAGTYYSPIGLSRQDGGLFNISSIDLAYINNPPDGPLSISFCGQKDQPGVCAVTQTFTLAQEFGEQTFIFDQSFTNLHGVLWYQGIGPLSTTVPGHQFDNIVVSSVPLPSSLILALSGLGIFFVFTQRRCGYVR